MKLAGKIKNVLLLVSICFSNTVLYSQIGKSSLLALLKNDKEDTNKVNHLNALAKELMNSNPDTAIILGTQEVEIISAQFNVPGEELEKEITTNRSPKAQNLKRLYINSFNNLGVCYRLKADYAEALVYFKKALSFAEDLKDKCGIAKCHGNIGVCFRLKGDYPQALGNFLKALTIDEEMSNSPNAEVAKLGKIGIAARFGSMGSVYWNQGDYAKALDYYSRAMKLNEELGDKKGIAANLGNSGSVYVQQGDFTKALECYHKALKIAEEVGYKQLQANTLGNIGAICKDKGNDPRALPTEKNQWFAQALDYYLKAMKIAEELGDKNGIAIQLGSIGSLYMESPSLPSPEGEEKKGFALAAKYLHRALTVSDSIGAMDNVKNWYEQLSTLYEKSNVPLPDTTTDKLLSMEETHLRALYYMKRYMAARDTLFSEARKKELLNKEKEFALEKKEAAAKEEKAKQLALEEANKKQTQLILIIVGAILILGIVFTGFILRSRKVARKQKVIIEEHKQMVEKSNQEKEELMKEINRGIKNSNT